MPAKAGISGASVTELVAVAPLRGGDEEGRTGTICLICTTRNLRASVPRTGVGLAVGTLLLFQYRENSYFRAWRVAASPARPCDPTVPSKWRLPAEYRAWPLAIVSGPTFWASPHRAAIRQAFLQTDAEAAHQSWRHVADQLRPRWPKVGTLMDDSKHDVLAYITFPAQHRYQTAQHQPARTP